MFAVMAAADPSGAAMYGVCATTLSIMTFSITTISIITLSIITLSIRGLYNPQH
jgi:hypothetical protein